MTRGRRRKREARAEAIRLRSAAEEDAIYERPDPPKQYVRRFGWLRIIEDYVRRLRDAELERLWKYLTLPGKYSIDIGLLWQAGIIDVMEDGKLCVAVCDQKYAEKVAAELQPKGGILAYSNRPLDKELADERSQLRDQFPFDVVNLDLCNSLIQAENVRNLETIEWIFKLQRGQSFLLLLTARPDQQDRERLLEILNQNLANEDEFGDAYADQYAGRDAGLCLNNYTRFAQIVFPKAIARWARFRGYGTREHFVAKYRRQGGFDMICHSFEFEPLGLRAPAKIHAPRFHLVPQNNIDERLNNELSSRTQNLATAAYVEFNRSLPPREAIDVMAVLAADAALQTELGNESQALIGWTSRP
jgi:hypothetical protein